MKHSSCMRKNISWLMLLRYIFFSSFFSNSKITIQNYEHLNCITNLLFRLLQMIDLRCCEIFESECWPSLAEDTVRDILKLDDLTISSEVQVFEALVRWGRGQLDENEVGDNAAAIKDKITPMLPLIRFKTMDFEMFGDFCNNHEYSKIFIDSEKLSIFLGICLRKKSILNDLCKDEFKKRLKVSENVHACIFNNRYNEHNYFFNGERCLKFSVNTNMYLVGFKLLEDDSQKSLSGAGNLHDIKLKIGSESNSDKVVIPGKLLTSGEVKLVNPTLLLPHTDYMLSVPNIVGRKTCSLVFGGGTSFKVDGVTLKINSDYQGVVMGLQFSRPL